MSDKYVVQFDSTSGLQYVAPGGSAVSISTGGGSGIGVVPAGLVGDNVADDAPAIQAALNTGHTVLLPKPATAYKLGSAVTTFCDGQKIIGENECSTFLKTATGSTNDMLRIKHSRCEVTGLALRPQSVSNIPLRVYGPQAKISNNTLLPFTHLSGTGMLLTEVDPATGTTAAGRYCHIISNNHIGEYGTAGGAFAYGIDTYGPTNGQNANLYQANHIICSTGIRNTNGGGNRYIANLFQQPLYTPASGIGLDLSSQSFGEYVAANYFESFAEPIKTRATVNTWRSVMAYGNHFDACTIQTVSSSGSTNLIDDRAAGFGGVSGIAAPAAWTPVDDAGIVPLVGAYGTIMTIGKFFTADFWVKVPAGTTSTYHATLAGLGVSIRSGSVGGALSGYTDVGSVVNWQVNPGTGSFSAYTLAGANASWASLSGKFIQGQIVGFIA